MNPTTTEAEVAVDQNFYNETAKQLKVINDAAAAVKKCSSAAEARPILEAAGAVFEADGLRFSFFNGSFKARLQGSRGESVGSKKDRSKAKAARKARRAARRG